jgi:hypothetical protein
MVQEQTNITRKFQDLIQIGMQPLSTAMLSASKVIDTMVGIIPGSSGIARTGTQTYINEKEKKELGETGVIIVVVPFYREEDMILMCLMILLRHQNILSVKNTPTVSD